MAHAATSEEAIPGSNVTGRHKVTLFKKYLWLHYYAFSGTTNFFGRRITRMGWLVGFGFASLCVMAVDTKISMAYRVIFFLALALCSGPFLALCSRSKFAVARTMPRFGSVGSELVYTVRVGNLSKRFQRGIAVLENLPDPRPTVKEFSLTPEPNEEKRNFWDRRYLFYRWKWLLRQRIRARLEESPCADLEPEGSVEVRMKLTPVRRGLMRLDNVFIACPDPTGMFRSLVRVPCHHGLLILPKRYPVGLLALPGSQTYQQGGVALASQVGESEEFVSLRDYRPGDPMKKIHWPSWARTGRPIVKEFVDEFFVRHGLVLDTFTENPFSEVFEEAVSVAASFACTIEEQDSLLDLLVIGPQAFTCTVGRGVGTLEKMLEVLASVKACQDKPFSTLENLVISHGSELSGCLCVFLEWNEDRQRFVRKLQQMQVPVKVVVMVAAGEKNGLPPGVMVDDLENFHVIPVDEVAERLRTLT